jgi:hypothetical protein
VRHVTAEGNLALINNETWLHQYDPDKSSLPPRKFRITTSASKIIATVFWDFEGLILIGYLPRGHTMTGEYWANLIPKVRPAIKEKRRRKLRHGVRFHQTIAVFRWPIFTTQALKFSNSPPILLI